MTRAPLDVHLAQTPLPTLDSSPIFVICLQTLPNQKPEDIVNKEWTEQTTEYKYRTVIDNTQLLFMTRNIALESGGSFNLPTVLPAYQEWQTLKISNTANTENTINVEYNGKMLANEKIKVSNLDFVISKVSAQGTTKKLAEKIAEEKGFDLFEIEPVEKYTKEDLSNLDIKDKTISNTNFDRCNLITSDYKNTYFEKVTFSNCDLSNTKFIDCNFREVEFNNCKLVGVNISNCHMTKVSINTSQSKYINIIDTKTKELTIKDSDFTESSFYNVELLKTILDNSKFNQAEIVQTKLFGIDFSTCEITGIKLDERSLKGIKVNQFQAIELARLLGIDIIE